MKLWLAIFTALLAALLAGGACEPQPFSQSAAQFDALSRLTNMVDGTGTNAFRYTAAGLLQSEIGPWANDMVTNTYVQGLRTAMSIVQPSGAWAQTYAYDAMWRMTTNTSPAGAFGYSYGFLPASPLVTGISLPNAATIANGYDSLGRLHQTVLSNYWAHPLDGYTYGVDALGLRTNIVRNVGLTNSVVTVRYDQIGQVTAWSAKEGSGLLRQNEQLGMGYDKAENLQFRTNGALAQTFAVDAANQLLTVSRTGTFTLSGATPAPVTNLTVNGLAAQTYGDFTFARTNLTLLNGTNSFTNIAQNVYGTNFTNTLTVNLPASVTLNYDNNGNLTNDGARSFAYDWENQLTNITLAGQWKADFVYDGLNRRRVVREFVWQSGAWTLTNEIHYVCDGPLVIQERDTNSNPLVTYTRGLDLSGSIQGAGGIGGLLARTDANGTAFYHADAVGNITALMDGNENIVARYLYNPFGKVLGQRGIMAGVNALQASSMFQLDGIGFYPRRPTDANLQRWLTQDPIGEWGGINLYGFVGNNPINWIDSWGYAIYPDNFIGPLPANSVYQWQQDQFVLGAEGHGIEEDFAPYGLIPGSQALAKLANDAKHLKNLHCPALGVEKKDDAVKRLRDALKTAEEDLEYQREKLRGANDYINKVLPAINRATGNDAPPNPYGVLQEKAAAERAIENAKQTITDITRELNQITK
jgi:RHS repeat-associated protein